MPRLTFGFALLCLASVGCSKQPVASTPPASAAAPASQADEAPSDVDDKPLAVADDEPDDPNRPWVATSLPSDYILIGQDEQMFGVFVDIPKSVGGHVPTALTLAVDTSGSMRGDKIKHAREAARRLIDEMEDGDIVSLVSFSAHAQVLVPSTTLDHHTRRDLLNIVEELDASGGTAMHDGLTTATNQMWSTPDTHLVRRLVVISDGKATVGPTDPSQLGNVAQVGLNQGIQVTALGVGLDYDELTLNELAVRSSGRLYHVEKSQQLPGIVEDEVALLESTAAANAVVEIEAAPGVQILGTDVAQGSWSQRKLVVPLGTMFGGQSRELLVRARTRSDGTEGRKALAAVRLRFRDPNESGLARVQEAVLAGTFTDDPAMVTKNPNGRTNLLIAMREASTFTQQASQQLNRGDLDAAEVQLAQAEKKLRDQAKVATSAADRRRAEASAARISSQRKGITKAKKKKDAGARKKASRALSLESNDATMDAFGF